MVYFSNTTVFGFEAALHGMRNPKNSWGKADSQFYSKSSSQPVLHLNDYQRASLSYTVPESPIIGPNDKDLMRRLISAGSEHRKFLRAIDIWAFIETNRGCWQEIDTYKVGTVRNSCSTMHKLGSRDLNTDDFQDQYVLPETLYLLNLLGQRYRETKDFDLVIQMKRMLPEAFIQGADYKMSYETALNMFSQRKNHRLPEWKWSGPDGPKQPLDCCKRMSICDWICTLPYMPEIIGWASRERVETSKEIADSGPSVDTDRIANAPSDALVMDLPNSIPYSGGPQKNTDLVFESKFSYNP